MANGRYRDFWFDLIEDRRAVVREAAYLGLVRADPPEGLAKLPRILRDRECGRSTLLYSMAVNIPGIQLLAQEAQKLSESERKELIDVLTEVGTDEALLEQLRRNSR